MSKHTEKRTKEEKLAHKKRKEEKKRLKKEKKVASSAKKETTKQSWEGKSESDIAEYRKKHSIIVSKPQNDAAFEDIAPVFTFMESCLPSDVLACTKEFKHPTPIQAQCIPILARGQDCIGIAKTGSGKTLAFSLPGLAYVKKLERGVTRMLIVSPTRELAMQSFKVVQHACSLIGLHSACIYGGADKKEQMRQLRKGADIIVATPGRLLGLVEEYGHEACVDLSKVGYFVLDEADRMLDMGFKPDITRISNLVGANRQTVMFSATWPEEIRSLAHEFLSNPLRVVVGSTEATANLDVKQIIEVIDPFKKRERLVQLLAQHKRKSNKLYRIIVFALYKKEAEMLDAFLNKGGYKCEAIHGNKNQHMRTQALSNFIEGKSSILVATDVAARGLDIPEVELVLNYTFPLTIEDYIHRIGRTGRAGAKGIAHTFFTDREKGKAGELVNVLRKAGSDVPKEMMQFNLAVKKKQHHLYGNHFKSFDDEPMPKAKHIKFD